MIDPDDYLVMVVCAGASFYIGAFLWFVLDVMFPTKDD
jgi:hypothetical protein